MLIRYHFHKDPELAHTPCKFYSFTETVTLILNSNYQAMVTSLVGPLVSGYIVFIMLQQVCSINTLFKFLVTLLLAHIISFVFVAMFFQEQLLWGMMLSLLSLFSVMLVFVQFLLIPRHSQASPVPAVLNPKLDKEPSLEDTIIQHGPSCSFAPYF